MSKPIFIAGCPRSGTSILAFFLGMHPNILAYLEPKGLYELFNELVIKRPVPKLVFRTLFSLWIPRRLAYATSKQQAAAHANIRSSITSGKIFEALGPLHRCTSEEQELRFFQTFLNDLLGGYARLCDRSRWCVKAPRYLYPNVDFIYRLHPDMKFVHIVRDGRDTVASIMKQPWARKGRNSFNQAVALWLTLEAGDKKAVNLPDRNFFRIRLEDLVRNEEHAIQLCEFLDESYDPVIRDYYRSRVRSQMAKMGRWKEDLTASEVAYIERVGGTLLARHGYA